MNSPEERTWLNLVALAAPAYPAGEALPPYGFTTRVLARLRAEEQARGQMERIGWRALFASVVVLLVTAGVALEVRSADHGDVEPGVGGLIQGADVPFS